MKVNNGGGAGSGAVLTSAVRVAVYTLSMVFT